MKLLKITKQSISEAVRILRNSGTVVYPTETAYALGCDATNKWATKKIFKIKNRPKKKNLPVICANKVTAARFFKVGKFAQRLITEYWPGPLSIILPKLKRGTLDSTVKGPPLQQGVVVRVSSNNVARALSRGLGKPIISTSANLSGEPAMYNARKIAETFRRRKHRPDLILDAGEIPKRLPSTIITIGGGEIEIKRQGEVNIR